MFFQSPASLWFALALPAIALLYILKRTYIDTEVSSHLLWTRALKEREANRPWQRLRRSLLLLLQLLAAALLVLALMEPSWWRTAAAARHVVIVLDRSASMSGPAALADGSASGETKLAAAKQAALQWLNGQRNAGAAVSVVTTGKEPEIVSLRERDESKQAAAIEAIRPTFGESDGAAALSLADALLRNEQDGEILLFTDGDWPDAASAEQMKLQAAVQLTVVPDIQRPGHAAAVAAFGVKDDPENEGLSEAVVTLRNDSGQTAVLKAGLYADGAAEPVRTVKASVAPGEWETVTVKALPHAAVYKAQLLTADDRYGADDARYRFPAGAGRSRALLVTKGNLFLEKALKLAGIRTVVADPEAFEPDGETTQNIDWVVIDGVPENSMAADSWRKLTAEKPVWRIVSADQSEAVRPADGTVEIQTHRVTRYLSFDDVHISRLVRTPSVSWGEPVVTFGGIPAIYAGQENGRPMLLFTFNLHDSDLPLRTEFPILVAQAAEWMSGGASGQLGEAVAGSQLEIDYAAESAKAEWILAESAPGLDRFATIETSRSIKADTDASGLPASAQTVPDLPGLYRFVEYDGKGAVIRERFLAVTADPREFSLTSGEQSLRLPNTAASPSEFGTPNDENPPGQAKERQTADSLIRWIVLGLLAVILMEWGVYRSGRTV